MSESAPKLKKLTLKQRRFVEEYAGDPNGVQAYFRAFGRNKSDGKPRSYDCASEQARRLLEKPEVQAELARAQEAWQLRVGVNKERVLSELAAVAFADPDDVYEADDDNGGLPRPRSWRDVSPAARKAIQSVKVKRKRLASDSDETAWEVEELEYRFHPKLDALDKLCKRLGLFVAEDAGDKPAGVPVELLTRLLALAGRAQPIGPVAPQNGVAVGAEPGAAEPRLPE